MRFSLDAPTESSPEICSLQCIEIKEVSEYSHFETYLLFVCLIMRRKHKISLTGWYALPSLHSHALLCFDTLSIHLPLVTLLSFPMRSHYPFTLYSVLLVPLVSVSTYILGLDWFHTLHWAARSVSGIPGSNHLLPVRFAPYDCLRPSLLLGYSTLILAALLCACLVLKSPKATWWA